MGDNQSLSHTKCKCKYHVVFLPKSRPKAPRRAAPSRRSVFRALTAQKESRVDQGHLMRCRWGLSLGKAFRRAIRMLALDTETLDRSSEEMHHKLAAMILPFAFITTFAAIAAADVAPSGPSCKCSMLGTQAESALAGTMIASGGLLLAVARRRRQR